ncbi:MAG: hypothetical protein NT090_00715 [Acidobacteria bacterium]|nr:hypothetical protein [Acidobacteriota bacterium]
MFDLSIAKKFRLIEGHTLAVRGEFFNFPNHADFGGANTVLSQAAFGTVSSTTAARQIQFALRYEF